MRRWSVRRGQAEPLPALVATVVVAAGIVTYAGVLGAPVPASTEHDVADPTLRRVVEALRGGGVVRPARVAEAASLAPAGYRCNVTVRSDDRTWTAGPRPPTGASRATAAVPVDVGDGVEAGTVRVEVWT